ncbi:olfactory receptor 2T8-like [Alligator sinensis]|uniref:Olfactory receptor 2T8-like n=1 Tax=Alligator sinensis TaxID=38654 RepID=A0A1U7SJL3_ALLSI|nr:olfactory receptor 2T8-like [Alligator sinensis]
MGTGNTTSPTEFVLLGLPNRTKVHTCFLAMILLAFLTAVFGNSLLMFLIQVDSSLHTPMYFFLSQLAFMDICQSLTIVPKMSVDLLNPGTPISPAGCGAQIFLVLTMGAAECLLLAAMPYDRYVAICCPLQYPILLKMSVCLRLAAGVWISAPVNALIYAVYTMHLPYCSSKEIKHIFCKVPTLLKLACSDTSTDKTLVFVSGIVVLLIPPSVVIISYAHILSTVLGMKSTKRQQKALATCSSHLTVVGMVYGAAIIMYMRPNAYHSSEQDMIVSLLYTVVTPMLNPLIYSLRNRDVLGALRKLVGKYRVIQQNRQEL